MNLTQDLEQIQSLANDLHLPIWMDTINLPTRKSQFNQTLNVEKKLFFTWAHQEEKILIFIAPESNFVEVFQYITFFQQKIELYITSNQLIRERIFQTEDLQDLEQNNFISDFLKRLLEESSNSKATDIHLEAEQNYYKIKTRINGSLESYPKKAPAGIILKIKLLSKMDITNSRQPQDGYFNFQNSDGAKFDLRVSTLPAVAGEKMVIRLLPLENLEINFKKLNFPASFTQAIEKVINFHIGWVLVAGPTGSGKTTTLYSIVKELIKKNLNIISIEDPVEYRLKGVTQIQVNEKIGITFSNILRASLRQDPDVILVGEIRDEETAKIAAASAKTGHLVLSTVHSGSVLEAIQRLKSFNIGAEDLANSVKLIIAQRLVFSKKEINRVPIVEFLENNDEIKQAILEQKNILEFENIMKKQNFISMANYANSLGLSLMS